MNLANIQLDNQKKILIVIFFVLVAYADVGYILKAQRAGLSRLDLKIAKLNTDLLNLNRDLENMRLSKNQPGLVKKAVNSSRILKENQISELLQEISSTANKFNIKIDQLRPSRPVLKEKTSGQDKVIPILINLDLVSDYHSLGKFIYALENASIFIGVSEMEISTQLPDYMKQAVTLVLKTYVTK
ncbi:MAG TPA: type 4a pilus biogenesis protein PilO [Candidatus Omnitrophota bacterium]|nr:type 4a pilus biogenesis protein PilO [Candidatus Omnitrophota bacterium]HPT39682.1 type 4a pilus biogenesis protein PilO [Candidatus Omnitrophota bacterium]